MTKMRFFVMGFTAPPVRTTDIYRPKQRTTVTLYSGETIRIPHPVTFRDRGHRKGTKGVTLRTHREG